jgi:hypothetical protein
MPEAFHVLRVRAEVGRETRRALATADHARAVPVVVGGFVGACLRLLTLRRLLVLQSAD